MSVKHFLAGVVFGVVGDRTYLKMRRAGKRLHRRVVTFRKPKIEHPELYFGRYAEKEKDEDSHNTPL